MRSYGKVGPKFWIGATGKQLRAKGAHAQLVALYLMTSPHANMLGLYYVSIGTIAHETGLGFEGASEGLQRAIEAGFCSYDEASEMVWVHEMAAYQIAEKLSSKDNQVKSVQKEYDELLANPFLEPFFEKYGTAFCMSNCRKFGSPSQAPSNPLRSQEQEQEQEQEEENPLSGQPDDAREILAYLNEKTDSAYRPVDSNLKLIRDRLKSGATVEQVRGVIDAKVAQWGNDPKMQEFLRPTTLFRASNFEQYLGQLGKPVVVQAGPAWHETDEGYLAQGEALGIRREASEPFQWFKWRVAKRVDDQGVIDKLLSAAQRDGIAEHERAYKFFHGCLPGQMSRAA
ncbi:conserved phage C-terminal domain-containing protein [Ralstonia wenshanensis]|uniref:conserved phage C-terminal domain-containing protein n=1 Tax=Ralstonia wenshanensis TaxID=2842456 RepID=UPI003D9524E9